MKASMVIVSLVAVVALIGTQISVSSAATDYVDLESFAVGDCAEVHYTAPTARATINLMSKKGDHVLHCDYRVKYSSQRNTVLLNAKLAGKAFNPKLRKLVPGVANTPGTTLQFVICPIAANGFSVTLNGKLLAKYTNSNIDITTVSRVTFNNYTGNAELQEICVNYG